MEQPGSLLREWAENYDYRKHRIQEFYSLMSIMDIEKTFAAYCNKNKVPYALTGFSGAARIAPVVRYNKAMLYAADISLRNSATKNSLFDIPIILTYSVGPSRNKYDTIC